VSPLETRVIADPGAFADVAADWDALVLAAPRPSPFVLHDWLRAWWTIYLPQTPMRFVTAWESGRMVGALPLMVARHAGARVGRLGRYLAVGDAAIAHASPDAVVPALATAIRAGGIDALDLNGIAGDSQLAAQLGTCGPSRVAEAFPAAILDMPDGWEAAYRRITSSKTRNTHGRRLRQLEEAGRVEFARHDTEAGIAGALDDAFRLHALRWEGRPDTSPFGTASGRAYQREALAAAARGDRARIVELRLDGEPIAFHLYLLLAGVMFVYRLAFDPAYAAFSPGLLTTIEAIRQASGEGATRVEFQRGDERYKRELSDGAETLVRLIALPSGVRGSAFVRVEPRVAAARLRLRQNERLLQAYRRGRGMLRRSPG
jgi:CelD/BcsL family acetyltransferase involved in cellulose biosynthesis